MRLTETTGSVHPRQGCQGGGVCKPLKDNASGRQGELKSFYSEPLLYIPLYIKSMTEPDSIDNQGLSREFTLTVGRVRQGKPLPIAQKGAKNTCEKDPDARAFC